MSDTINISIYGGDAFQRRMEVAPNAVLNSLVTAMKAQMFGLSDYVRSQKLSGQVLNRRSGDLSRSITGQAELDGTTVRGITGTKGVPYAGVHEFGATFWREVDQAFGRPILPRSVIFHYPERSYLRSSASERADAIRTALQQAVTGALNAT